MKSNRLKALKFIGLSEGGYVNHPEDPGGATNMGVTQRTYNSWRRANNLPPQTVRNITKEESHRIFIEQYFRPVWFDRMPDGLDYCLADYSVNSGPSRAVKDLQRVLNSMGHRLSVDGVMGFNTFNAVSQAPTKIIIRRLCERRMKFLKSLRTWKTFGKGWTRRVMGNDPGAQSWDNGVIDRATEMFEGKDVKTDPIEAEGKGRGLKKGPAGCFEAYMKNRGRK